MQYSTHDTETFLELIFEIIWMILAWSIPASHEKLGSSYLQY